MLFKETSAEDLLGVDAIRPFRIEGDDLEATEELPKLPKTKSRKPARKKVDVGEEKASKGPRKKKDAVEKEPKKPRKPKVKVADHTVQENDTLKERASKNPRAKKAAKEASTDEGIKEKPARKSRSKKADGESQTTLLKGQVTKSLSKSSSDKVVRAVKSKNLEPASPDPFADSIDLGLVEAIRRRTEWTPPRATGKKDITPISGDYLDFGSTSSGSAHDGGGSKGLTDLFTKFRFSKLDNNDAEKKSLETDKPRKRKLIELVKTSVSTAAAASPKGKASKKKARTITGLATSAYAEEEEITTEPAPLLQYFSRQAIERPTNDGFKFRPKLLLKPRSKLPVKGRKAKKGSADAPILLSPESALKESGNQDFVFGTSSQLAREDSPTLLRDLHEAMRASNEVDDDDPFADSIHASVFATRGKALVSAKRDLWSAAAREVVDDLLEVEMVDLVDSLVATKHTKSPIMPEASKTLLNGGAGNVWHDVDEFGENIEQDLQTSKETTKQIGPVEAAIRAELLSSPPSSQRMELTPKNSKTKKTVGPPFTRGNSPVKTTAKAAKATIVEMPNFSSYTTAQLAKEIASYRFKPVKSRDGMIALLEKCWEGKNRIALGALGTNVLSLPPMESSKPVPPPSSQVSAAVSPKRPRGRPRKDSTVVSPPKQKVGRPKKSLTVEFLEMDSDTPLSQIRTPSKSKRGKEVVVEDISDPETEVLPSPPRRQASQVKTPLLPLNLFTDLDVNTSSELSPTSCQILLFTHITRAIKNAPPSRDPQKPSWHEKILMYDPIVLEDLTVWLNTGALEKVGWDGEVEPKEVKKWCEGRSICCLWKENLRGGARNRY
jgi:Slx4 endonuclease